MENEKLTTRLGSVAFRTTGRHSSFRRFCELFEINLGKPFDKDTDMSTDLSAHLFRFEVFVRLYEHDYYRDRSPKDIAKLLGRKTEEILEALKVLHPDYFMKGHDTPKKENNLKYVSSFEIAKYLGGNYDFLSYK